MKKIILLFLICFSAIRSYSCDACGCSLGGNYFGILPQFNKNFAGLRWSQARFYAYMNHQSELLGPESSNDTYNKLELWGRFYVNKKIQVFAFLPYNSNSMNGTHQSVSSNGLGDVTLMANYLLINTGEDKIKRFKHTLVVGGGVKLPSGKYKLEDQGKLVNPNFQMGTGSTDFLLSTMYTIRYQKIGTNLETGYKINTHNSNNYHFGNQYHITSQVFFWQNVGSFSFLPNAGVYYELGEKHKADDIIQVNTGGSALLSSLGLETYYKTISLGFNFKHPLSQHYNSDDIADITSKDRWTVSLTYNF